MKLLSAIAAFLLAAAMAVPAQAIQCVPYAREASGLNLKGNAWQWWDAAAGTYERGKTARTGAVLVFTRQGNMRYGHVSVVTRVVSPRLVMVDHANWAPAGSRGRGQITRGVPVLDVSANNDWSRVRVWHHPAEDFGNRTYRTDGYIYNPASSAPAARSAVERVALAKAAAIFPKDKGLNPAEPAKPVPASLPAKAAPAPAPPAMVKQAVQVMAPAAINDSAARAAARIFAPKADRSNLIFN